MNFARGERVDRYVVQGELGRGGMATVYQVQHATLASEHVLKVLTIQGGAVRERLLLEGQVQARLKHPNVVEVTDVVDLDGQPGLVMELVRGPSLDLVLEDAPLPLEAVDALVPRILAGVAAAHHEGVVHRDLKPANILLDLRRGKVMPKVADFGLVKMLETDPGKARTRTGATMGTPQYMAPEQVENAADVDAKADIWAIGAILYELVTGHRSFDGDSHYAIFQKVVTRDVVPVASIAPHVPQRMIDAIEACLRPRAERPAELEVVWGLWSGSDQPLDVAAAGRIAWDEARLQRLETLSPVSLVPTTDAPADTSPSGSSETFFDAVEPPTSQPTLAPLADDPVQAGPETPAVSSENHLRTAAIGGGAFAGVVVLGLLLLGAVGIAGLVLVGRAPAPTAPEVAPPAPVVAPPAPLVAPVTPPPTPFPPPELAPAPEATPSPLPVAQPPATPEIATAPRPAPAAPSPPTGDATLQLKSDIPVSVEGPSGVVVAGPIPPGDYTVTITLDGQEEAAGGFTVAPGGTARVTCSGGLRKCLFK